jgi:hypothetical protein
MVINGVRVEFTYRIRTTNNKQQTTGVSENCLSSLHLAIIPLRDAAKRIYVLFRSQLLLCVCKFYSDPIY